jgi:hypothetical protein
VVFPLRIGGVFHVKSCVSVEIDFVLLYIPYVVRNRSGASNPTRLVGLVAQCHIRGSGGHGLKVRGSPSCHPTPNPSRSRGWHCQRRDASPSVFTIATAAGQQCHCILFFTYTIAKVELHHQALWCMYSFSLFLSLSLFDSCTGSSWSMLYPEYKHVPPTDLHLHDPKSLTSPSLANLNSLTLLSLANNAFKNIANAFRAHGSSKNITLCSWESTSGVRPCLMMYSGLLWCLT